MRVGAIPSVGLERSCSEPPAVAERPGAVPGQFRGRSSGSSLRLARKRPRPSWNGGPTTGHRSVTRPRTQRSVSVGPTGRARGRSRARLPSQMRARLVVAHNQVEGTQQQPEVPSLWQPAEGVPGANASAHDVRRDAVRAAFISACGPYLGACKCCDLSGFPWPDERADFDDVVKHFGPLIRR